jgi:hypothetical protein
MNTAMQDNWTPPNGIGRRFRLLLLCRAAGGGLISAALAVSALAFALLGLLAIPGLALSAPPPARTAASRVFIRRGQVSLAQRDESPSFISAEQLRLVDRGRLVHIGSGITAEHEMLYLLRLSDLSPQSVRVPLDAFVRDNPGIKADENDQRPTHEQFWIRHLLFYDSSNGEAGVEVVDRSGSDGVRRNFFIRWDLRANRLDRATLVARERPGTSHAESLALGYDPKLREFYYVRQIYGERDDRLLHVIAFSEGKARVVAEFRSRRPLRRETYFDAQRQRALLVEYAELANPEPPPQSFLVDLAGAKVTSVATPLTAYGVAFAPDGRRVYAYSSQLGEIVTLDTASGRLLATVRAGKLGHALGQVSPAELLLVRNSGLDFFRLGEPLRPAGSIPMARIASGMTHVSDSLTIEAGALVRNGDLLHVLAFPR